MGSIAIEEQAKALKPSYPTEANTLNYAKSLDTKDHLRDFRSKFIIPSKANIKATTVSTPGTSPQAFTYTLHVTNI
jgi:kynureninase